MQQPALYFPFIYIRDDDWLKTAALYWPSIRRLVRHRYPRRDSPTAQTFSDPGILRDDAPKRLVASMARALLDMVMENADHLLANATPCSYGNRREPGDLSQLGAAPPSSWRSAGGLALELGRRGRCK